MSTSGHRRMLSRIHNFRKRRLSHRTSRLERVTSNQLVNVVIGFLLTGVIGSFLTQQYATSAKQLDDQRAAAARLLEHQRQDARLKADRVYLEHQKDIEFERDKRQRDAEQRRTNEQRKWEVRRAYVDKLNETRFFRVSEVWERVFRYRAEIHSTFTNYWRDEAQLMLKVLIAAQEKQYTDEQELLKDPQIAALLSRMREPMDKLDEKSAEVLAFAEKNQMWLGARRYRAVEEAVRLSRILIANARLAPRNQGDDSRLAKLKAQYDQTQERFERLRDSLWSE